MEQVEENISWIIDGLDKSYEYSEAIEFVHSFGLKCDSVGWCTMKLNSEKEFELLERIKASAKAKKGRTRCYYERVEGFYETDWYILTSKRKCTFDSDDGIKAYKLSPNDHIADADCVLVASQAFVDCCMANGFSGVNFAYMRDVGRYKANTYYAILPSVSIKKISSFGNEFEDDHKAYELMDSFGGNLSRVAKCFDTMQMIDCPIMLPKGFEPSTDFCYVAFRDCAKKEVLIRKSVADILMSNKLISKSNLIPVKYCDVKIHKRLLCNPTEGEFVKKELLDYWAENRERFEKKKKPAFVPTEKDSLKLLRQAKKERSNDFSKALSRVLTDSITDDLSVLKPVFKITNGCYLNDEINLLPYVEIAPKTKVFLNSIVDDELVINELKLDSCYVIGSAINGDTVLLKNDSSVIIFDHEDYYNSREFNSIWEFIFECIEL